MVRNNLLFYARFLLLFILTYDLTMSLLLPIGTASANSIEFNGIRPRMHINNKCDAGKQTVINEVYAFSIKYRYSDIILKKSESSFMLLKKRLW